MVKDTDRGYAERLRRLRFLATGAKVRAGIHAPQGAAYHGSVHGVKLTNIEVAAWQEFGTARIPARSFIGVWFTLNVTKLHETYKTQALRYLKGTGDEHQLFNRVGAWMVGGIKQRIAKGIPPPNAPSTIAAKGSSKPLIDTGQLRASIGYSVILPGLEWLTVEGDPVKPQKDKRSKSSDYVTRLLYGGKGAKAEAKRRQIR